MNTLQFLDDTKPYKILQKSPKGSIYDVLFCIKCCSTHTRGNYSTHKKTPKHIRNHTEQKDTKKDCDKVERKTTKRN